jgi:thymidylate synthase (FAD)
VPSVYGSRRVGYRLIVLDHGYLNLVESWGSDERIIEAARMSTNKGFQGWGPKHDESCDMKLWNEPTNCSCDAKPGDEKLLAYLWNNHHYTPFEMAGLIIEVQAPIMVFREWHRHRTQSYNELSARYTPLPDLFYIPSIERIMGGAQSSTNKQSSGDGIDEAQAGHIRNIIEEASRESRGYYDYLLGSGLSRELARLVIPVNQYSRMRASANLRNWLSFLTIRTDPAAQWEIRQFADALSEIVKQVFPRSWELWSLDGKKTQ